MNRLTSTPCPAHSRSTPWAVVTLACAAFLMTSLAGCIPDDENAGGFVGVIDGQEFTVASGRAEIFNGQLEIILSDVNGEGCSGADFLAPEGSRKVILATEDPTAGTHSTDSDAQISIQIKSTGEVFDGREVNGSFTLDTIERTEGGQVAGTIRGTSDSGDDLDGNFFVEFCP